MFKLCRLVTLFTMTKVESVTLILVAKIRIARFFFIRAKIWAGREMDFTVYLIYNFRLGIWNVCSKMFLWNVSIFRKTGNFCFCYSTFDLQSKYFCYHSLFWIIALPLICVKIRVFYLIAKWFLPATVLNWYQSVVLWAQAYVYASDIHMYEPFTTILSYPRHFKLQPALSLGMPYKEKHFINFDSKNFDSRQSI